jgi:hypothetical protein
MHVMPVQQDPDSARTVYLVEERANPSTDYFVLPAVSGEGQRVLRCGFADLPDAGALAGAIVIFVRYVPPAWMDLVAAVRPLLGRLVLFIDDDVLDMHASAGMPWRYRFKLARLAAWRSRWLRRQDAELWVATPYLQRKYAGWQPRLVSPSPAIRPIGVCRVFYHGSASHRAEIRWLRPVMEEVLRRDERITFEIVGGRDVYRLYRGVPRVTVVHPMRWPAYQAFLALQGRHIGLAPLLDLPFNHARACTKFFDITRSGAAGVYSADSACADVVIHGTDGLVVGRQQDAWVEAIGGLAADEPLRRTLLRNASAKLDLLAVQALQNRPRLWAREQR